MEHKISEWFVCRLCWTEHDHPDDAMVCCNPVRHIFACECEEEFETQSEAAHHVHGKALQEGTPVLAEWATAMEVAKTLE